MPHTKKTQPGMQETVNSPSCAGRCWMAACGACGDVCVRLCVALQAHSDPWWRARGVEALVRAALAPTWRVPVTLKC